MKNIVYMGQEYEVEDWVNYVAMDEDGEIWGYESEPEELDRWFSKRERSICLNTPEKYIWQNTLQKI